MKALGSPRRKTFSETYYDLAPSSFCATTVIGGPVNPSFVHIRLRGPIANIPSLKNQKIHGTNILRPDAKAKLVAMSNAFFKSVNNEPPLFKGVEVAMVLLCAYRKNAFDEDNVVTTVRDWLEPRFIRGGDREWGVGIVANDRAINAFGLKKKRTAKDADITEIYLRPLAAVEEARDRFLSEVTGIDIKTCCQ